MNAQELIKKKRNGETLTASEIRSFVAGVTGNIWADYQTSAFLMACYLNGLTSDEQSALTAAMLASGERLDFSALPIPKADKHSTGGVGDKTSLVIAPLAAACGLAVPMISGRGLGHTGGTLDKLESIKGYNVNLTKKDFYNTVEKCGFALAGQTENIVPADKKLYALRDATATVDSIPLIVASIMSKKLAEGLDALVLDVKTGIGAFMPNFEDSHKLASALVETGKSFGVKTEAVISEMSEPLGKFAGNALEVYECVKILMNDWDALMEPTVDLSVELTARMLTLGGIEENYENAKRICLEKIKSGAALAKFKENIRLQSGDETICDNPDKLLADGLIKIEIKSDKSGFVHSIDTLAIGESIVEIGGGRRKTDDLIDHQVGFEMRKKIGDQIEKNEVSGILYCRHSEKAEAIRNKISIAFRVETEQTSPLKLIKEIVS